MIGKTIARIEEAPTDPKYGYAQDNMLLIHFTDGTAMSVTGHSYEEVSQSYQEESREDVRAFARAAQGRREQERIARLKREEWNAQSPEERDRRRTARRAKMNPFALAMEDMMVGMCKGLQGDYNRATWGSIITIPVANKKSRARRS